MNSNTQTHMVSEKRTNVRVAIVGSRDFKDYSYFSNNIDSVLSGLDQTVSTIVSGGATGADTFAIKYATEHGIDVKVFNAQWSLYGRSAGPKRNSFIVNYADIVIAFPLGRSIGTNDTIRKARASGKPVYVFNM